VTIPPITPPYEKRTLLLESARSSPAVKMETGMEATMTEPTATAHDPKGKVQKVSRGTPTTRSGMARASWEPKKQHPPSRPAPNRNGIELARSATGISESLA